jgi:hypothetical protein
VSSVERRRLALARRHELGAPSVWLHASFVAGIVVPEAAD